MPFSSSTPTYDVINKTSAGSASSLLSPVSRRRSHSQSGSHRAPSRSQTRSDSPNNNNTSGNNTTRSNSFPNSFSSNGYNSSLFVGINLPADKPNIAHPYTDRALVNSALSSDYNMITSRISSPAYRRRIEELYSKSEEAWGLAIATSRDSNSNQRNSYQQGPYSHQRVSSSAHSVASRTSSAASWHHIRSVSGASNASRRTRVWPNAVRSQDLHPFDSLSVPPLELDDILLLPGPHLQKVIALAAPWAELDSKNPSVAALSVQALIQEVMYAVYCGVVYIVLPGPKRRTNVEQYASAVAQILATAPPRVQLMVNLPFAEDDYVSSRTGIHVPPADHLSIWDVWNTIRTITNYPPNLSVALQIPPKCSGLPPAVANRWYAEPVKMLTLSASIFMPNAKKYPVLPKATQNLLFRFFSKSPFIMLADVYDFHDFAGGHQSYLLYLRHLLRIRPKPGLIDSYAAPYADMLQLPLQPLADNLENATYEVFERDATKYNIYEKAIAAALMDIPYSHIEVAIAGAGRGPLVEKALNAAATVGKTVHIYAIEKNASACIHLTRRREFEWTPENLASSPNNISSVDVVHSDLRSWRPPAGPSSRVQLIVSELLGSFGDNELSPECIDALDNPEVLDPKHGIIIPQEYAAWFTPVMSPELYKAASNFQFPNSSSSTFPNSTTDAAVNSSVGSYNAGFKTGPNANPLNTSSVFHAPYVVHFNSIDYIAPSQYAKAWTFSHPSPTGAYLAFAETSSEANSSTNGVDNDSATYSPAAGRGTSLYQEVHRNNSRVSSSSGASAFRPSSLIGSNVNANSGFNVSAPGDSDSHSLSFVSSSPRATANNVSSTPGLSPAAATALAETNAAVKTLLSAASKNLTNTRKIKHTFQIPNQCVIHGLAGFFECRLYGNIGFSTRPDLAEDPTTPTSSTTSVNGGRSDTPLSYVPDSGELSESDFGTPKTVKNSTNNVSAPSSRGTAFGIPQTKDMLSWFPIWFPFSRPMYINEQSEVDISMWRRTDGSRVWYEWAMESFLSTGKLASQKLSPDILEDLAKASAMPPNFNGNGMNNNMSSIEYDVDMSEEGHRRRIKQVADKYAELQSKRRIRTGSSELHNPGGVHYSMLL